MPYEFDQYAECYNQELAASLGNVVDVDRFARYKVDEIAYLLRGATVERLLDFGCGIGRSFTFLTQAFPNARLFGFDPSEESIALAQAQHRFVCASATWTLIGAQQFDCI